jgi:hypothetical protein
MGKKSKTVHRQRHSKRNKTVDTAHVAETKNHTEHVPFVIRETRKSLARHNLLHNHPLRVKSLADMAPDAETKDQTEPVPFVIRETRSHVLRLRCSLQLKLPTDHGMRSAKWLVDMDNGVLRKTRLVRIGIQVKLVAGTFRVDKIHRSVGVESSSLHMCFVFIGLPQAKIDISMSLCQKQSLNVHCNSTYVV